MNTAFALAPDFAPDRLSDADLLQVTRGLVGRSNQLLGALLVHLGEVEARGVHRERACASLYTYCIYELRFSEDEAYRRVTAARLVRRFPALLDAIASGELHLTGLLMLGPHLTEANLLEVLARAKHRTKKELARLVRELNPLPDVPPLIEPLGPVSSSAAPNPSSNGNPVSAVAPKDPTWDEYTQSFCPVRNLLPGDRPRDWMGAGEAALDAELALRVDGLAQEASPVSEEPAPAPLEPQRYRVQFTASEEYVKLIEEAKALLSHETPARALDELHLAAMRAFVSELKKQKHAVGARPPKSKEPPAADPSVDGVVPRRRGNPERSLPERRSRHIHASVRRAVFARDAGRCTYVDDSGQRCRETHRLEYHHLEPFAREGAHSVRNVTLRCQAHNHLAAERDFGREFMDQRRDARPHETFCTQSSRNERAFLRRTRVSADPTFDEESEIAHRARSAHDLDALM